jgi:hypothetical protein
MANVVQLTISSTPVSPQFDFPNVAWFPGMNVLDVLTLADATVEDNFTFSVLYGSLFGAFVSEINGVPGGSSGFWMLYINGQLASSGISESLILDPNWTIEFRFEAPPAGHKQVLAFEAAKPAGEVPDGS